MEAIYSTLVSLVPPAVLLAIVVYFVRFFGKVISDQKPFSDERNWEIEISGINFFLNIVLVPGTLGVLAALNFGDFGMGHWTRFVIVSVFTGLLWFIVRFLTKKIYEIKSSALSFRGHNLLEEEVRDFGKFILKFLYFVPLWIFPIIFTYVLAIEYKANNLGWIIIIASEVFLGFIFTALIYSLRSLKKLPKINIIFIDEKDSMYNITLLKVNDSCVRVRVDDRAILINRNLIKKIEFLNLENISLNETEKTQDTKIST